MEFIIFRYVRLNFPYICICILYLLGVVGYLYQDYTCLLYVDQLSKVPFNFSKLETRYRHNEPYLLDNQRLGLPFLFYVRLIGEFHESDSRTPQFGRVIESFSFFPSSIYAQAHAQTHAS